MDQHKLRSLVFEKTGVRVDIDDPIDCLVKFHSNRLAGWLMFGGIIFGHLF